MNKINCLVVDDEELAREILERYISQIPNLQLAGSCSNAMEALAKLNEEKIDLMFLDIQMPQITGTEFLKNLPNAPKVIFTTAYSEYAVDGFDLNAVDYMVKPISFERFIKGVNKVFTHLKLQHSNENSDGLSSDAFIYLKADAMMVKLLLKDIRYIESDRNYVKVFTESREIHSYITLSAIEEKLPKSMFLRIHRSFIVSRQHIDAFSQSVVQVLGKQIPIGRNYKEIVSEELGNLES
jgi:DNA-binding LytR/AlgR family response regulator